MKGAPDGEGLVSSRSSGAFVVQVSKSSHIIVADVLRRLSAGKLWLLLETDWKHREFFAFELYFTASFKVSRRGMICGS